MNIFVLKIIIKIWFLILILIKIESNLIPSFFFLKFDLLKCLRCNFTVKLLLKFPSVMFRFKINLISPLF